MVHQLQEDALGLGEIPAVQGKHPFGKGLARIGFHFPHAVGVAVKDLVHPDGRPPLQAFAHVAAAVTAGAADDIFGAQDAGPHPAAHLDQALDRGKTGRDGGGFQLIAVAYHAHHHIAHIQGDAQPHFGLPQLGPLFVQRQHLLLDSHCRAHCLALLAFQHHVVAVVGKVEHRAPLPGGDGGRALDHLVDAVEQGAGAVVVYPVGEGEPHHHHRHPLGGKGVFIHLHNGAFAQQIEHPLGHEPQIGVDQVHLPCFQLFHGLGHAVEALGHALQLIPGTDPDPAGGIAPGQRLHGLGQPFHPVPHQGQEQNGQRQDQNCHCPYPQGQSGIFALGLGQHRRLFHRKGTDLPVLLPVQGVAAALFAKGHALLQGLGGGCRLKAGAQLGVAARRFHALDDLPPSLLPLVDRVLRAAAGQHGRRAIFQSGCWLGVAGSQSRKARQFPLGPLLPAALGPGPKHALEPGQGDHGPHSRQHGPPAQGQRRLALAPTEQAVPQQRGQQQDSSRPAGQQQAAGCPGAVEDAGQVLQAVPFVQQQPVAVQQHQRLALVGQAITGQAFQRIALAQFQHLADGRAGQVAVKHF